MPLQSVSWINEILGAAGPARDRPEIYWLEAAQ
jgi:hypothetical protein